MKSKKIISIIIAVVLMMSLAVVFAACDKNGGETKNPDSGNNPVTPPAPAGDLDKNIADESLKNIVGTGKVFVTTIGQGDMAAVKNLVQRAGATGFTENAMLEASAVADGSTVFISVGASGKGLGAAGTDATRELERANAFSAKANKINIVCVHTGGAPRRGEMSDPTIKVVAACSKVMLVVNAGNADGLFDTLSSQNNVALYKFSATAKMLPSFKYLLGK